MVACRMDRVSELHFGLPPTGAGRPMLRPRFNAATVQCGRGGRSLIVQAGLNNGFTKIGLSAVPA